MKNSDNMVERRASGSRAPLPVRVYRLYRDGFRQMTVGKYLWALILLKLFFMFAIMKLFFFPNLLERDYDNDEERAGAVRKSLLDPARTRPVTDERINYLHHNQ